MSRRDCLAAASLPLFAGALPLSGCATAGDSPTLPQSPLSTTAALRIAHISNLFEYAPVWIAVNQGFFSQEGLNASFQVLGSVPKINEVTLSGEFDIGIGVPEGVIANAEAGGPLRFFGGLSRKVAVSLIAQPHLKRIADLKGARLGVSGLKEGTGILMQDVVTSHGLQPGDLQLVATGIHTTRWEKLQSGEIDVALQPFPFNLMAEAKGFNNLGDFPDMVPAYQFIAIAARKPWLDANPEVAARFLRAVRRGIVYMNEQRAGTIDIAVKQTGLSREFVEKTWAFYTAKKVVDPYAAIDPAALRKTIEVMIKTGSLPAVRAGEIDRYIDPRPSHQAFGRRA
jgi:ABC-type nitrate/sulfonate/bicarbonate transport system substrate-binding protein